MKTKKIVTTAMFSALIFVVTAYLHINVGVGYVNFGDAFMLLAVCLLGTWYGAFCGAVGGALADLASGFGVYAPYTLAIKAIEGLVCGLIISLLCKHGEKHNIKDNPTKEIIEKHKESYKNDFWGVCIAFFAAALIMVVGYFGANIIIGGTIAYALPGIVTDCVQGAVSIIVGMCLTILMSNIPYVRELFDIKLLFKKHKRT